MGFGAPCSIDAFVSHTGLGPEHVELSTHCTQLPFESQRVAPASVHCALPVQPAWHDRLMPVGAVAMPMSAVVIPMGAFGMPIGVVGMPIGAIGTAMGAVGVDVVRHTGIA